jgi:hypothetical protein
MTTPAPVGTADWNTTFASAKSVLLHFQGRTLNGSESFGPFTVGNFHSVGLQCDASSNNINVLLQWFIDQAMTIELTRDQIEAVQFNTFDQTIVVKGPFLKVTVQALPVNPAIYDMLLYEATDSSTPQRFPTDNLLLEVNGLSVAASSIQTRFASKVYLGPASLVAYSSDGTSWFIEVLALRAGNITEFISRIDNTFPKAHHQLYLPSCTVQVNMHNLDASARTFYVGMSTKPLYP